MALLTIWAVNYPWWDELMCRTERWLRIDEYLVCRVRRVCHVHDKRGEHTDARDNASVIRGTVRHCNEYRHARPRPERCAPRSGKGMDLSQRLPAPERQAVLEREAGGKPAPSSTGARASIESTYSSSLSRRNIPEIKIDFVRLSESDLADKLLLENRTQRINSDPPSPAFLGSN